MLHVRNEKTGKSLLRRSLQPVAQIPILLRQGIRGEVRNHRCEKSHVWRVPNPLLLNNNREGLFPVLPVRR